MIWQEHRRVVVSSHLLRFVTSGLLVLAALACGDAAERDTQDQCDALRDQATRRITDAAEAGVSFAA
jgi:hypothetical protein